jgi:hypothetical protein
MLWFAFYRAMRGLPADRSESSATALPASNGLAMPEVRQG